MVLWALCSFSCPFLKTVRLFLQDSVRRTTQAKRRKQKTSVLSVIMMRRPMMYSPSPWTMPPPQRRPLVYGLSPWTTRAPPFRPSTREMRGPSPWVPATILGVILVIAVMPYMSLPQPPPVVYQRSPSFPLPLLLIPVVLFILAQWLSGSPWRPGFRPGSYNRSYPSWGNRSFAPGGKPRVVPWWQQQQQRAGRPWWRPSAGPAGYGYRDANNMSYGNNQNWTSGVWRGLMDYSGHWLLILLGFALFAIVSSG